MLRLARPDEKAPTVRRWLHDHAGPAGVEGEELTAEVVHWGRLADEEEQLGRVPTVQGYAERYECTEFEAEFRLVVFENATGHSPLDFHAIQWQAAVRLPGISFFDNVRIVAS